MPQIIGVALIDVQSLTEVATHRTDGAGFAWRLIIPGGGVCDFSDYGQTVGDGRYKTVPRELVNVSPFPNFRVTSESVEVLSDKVKVTRVYEEISTPARIIGKSVILSRLTNAQLAQAFTTMTERQREIWRSGDQPTLPVDNPQLLALLQAIGADPNVVLAP